MGPAIFQGISAFPPGFGPSAVTIGNFDGVHAGHRRILQSVTQRARANGWVPAVLTFDPHPARVVAPDGAPRLITTMAQRCALMEEDGIEAVLILNFNREISLWTPHEFVERTLVRALGARAVFVGDDFRFGHRQAGDLRVLKQLGAEFNFEVDNLHAVSVRGARASSTLVRQMVQSGHVAAAARVLSRPYCLEGDVVSGHGIGSKQTVPTLNLRPEVEVLPANGVYVTRTSNLASRSVWNSVTNVGFRPTFEGQGLTIETFLLGGFSGETPPRIRVEFLWYLRPERRFASPNDLKQQILKDVARTDAYFRRRVRWTGLAEGANLNKVATPGTIGDSIGRPLPKQ